MKGIVIGLGEVGSALYEILKSVYPATIGCDKTIDSADVQDYPLIHICYPYSDKFISETLRYIHWFNPKYVVVHSSIPVGTCAELFNLTHLSIFHSPVRGQHPNMIEGLKAYVKYLSFDSREGHEEIKAYFSNAGFDVKLVPHTRSTELAKLLELSRYGLYIAFAKEQDEICKKFGVDYDQVVSDYEKTRSEGLRKLNRSDLCQPILYPFTNYVGGHCTVEDMEILLEQNKSPLLEKALEIDRGTKIWGNVNIYKTARIGKGCSIGFSTEIGENVVIGNNVRIGANCFIPEGVTIEDDVFIAPKVTFSNDKYPPSGKSQWGKILVKKGATIGMGSIILPNVTIGEGALVGAGSVITKDVPANRKWYGNPGVDHGER